MLIDNEQTDENLVESINVTFEKTSDGQNMKIYVGDYCVGLTEKELDAIETLRNSPELVKAHNRET